MSLRCAVILVLLQVENYFALLTTGYSVAVAHVHGVSVHHCVVFIAAASPAPPALPPQHEELIFQFFCHLQRRFFNSVFLKEG